MKKIVKSVLCTGLCGTMLFAFGCKQPESGNLSETRALQLSTGAVDGNFNPFFYTAQNDGNMVSNTQIAMLTTDEKGEVVAGQNQPTVVLDYRETKYSSREPGQGTIVTEEGAAVGRTEYEFVIKNGIKFSDGEELSIVDVLFNLYVYLDSAYTGSSTIYSTDIQGLKAYRAQEPGLGDDSTTDTDARFRGEANDRIQTLVRWSLSQDPYIDVEKDPDASKDLATVKEEFENELIQRWNSCTTGWRESYEKTHRFNHDWEAFLYETGLVSEQVRINADLTREKIKDGNGKIYTTLDPWQEGNSDNQPVGIVENQHLIDAINAAVTDEKINEFLAQNSNITDREMAKDELTKNAAVKLVYDNYTLRPNIAEVLSYWSTAETIREQFTNEQRSKYFEEQKKLGNGVKKIKGISSYSAKGSDLNTSFKGVMKESYVAGDDYSVLKVVINGVDPKAIYNFAFAVAPLHYYSGTYKGVDYVKEARAKYNKEGEECFGIDVGNPDFFKTVLQESNKVGLPIGAGPYMASDFDGNPTKDKDKFKAATINFVRNPYFETVGDGIENAKIKLVRYKVLQDDQIMSALTTQSIDFGMPNATPTNISTVSQSNYLSERHYTTGGYGYIGINPKAVPEYKVRQAIMKAMDTTMTTAYYGTLAEVLYRPLTKTSWVYENFGPNAPINQEYPDIAYYASISEITTLVEQAGYEKVNGVYTKTRDVEGMSNAAKGKTLKLSFTIAGDTTDHPAYLMLDKACKELNDLGFDITLKTDPRALLNLATGGLEVWAAAWSSSIDPDPYQIYHKDSGATSVLNWNYRNILNNPTDWSYEYDIIQELSDEIDDGRATTSRNLRADIYGGGNGRVGCLNLIMKLAVELPTYQRNDMCVYNKNVIDANSLVKNPSFNMGLFDRLWEIDYK